MTQPARTGKVTQARLLHSERIKLRTLRSTFWSLFVAIGATFAAALGRFPVLRAKHTVFGVVVRSDRGPASGSSCSTGAVALAIAAYLLKRRDA
jgi:hypothetical protein